MPGIFISYRRADSPDATGRIYDRLVAEFGRAKVFKDIDSIPLGRDFRSHLGETVGSCDAVLAIVGPHWADAHDEAGKRRLEDADDFVRIELEAALARNIPVVPVLVGHALMPGAAQLPASLTQLAFRQSIEVRPDPDFHHDTTRLLTALRRILDPHAPVAETAEDAIAHTGSTARYEARWRRRAAWAASIAAIAVAGVIATLAPMLRHLREVPPPEMRVDVVTPATRNPGIFALSPDGRQIVFVASGDGASRLWLRSLDSTTAQPLAGTEGGTLPFWSPDGRSIGFFAGDALKRLDLGGGAPRILAPITGHRGASWSADGTVLFAPQLNSSLARVPASGGDVQTATTLGSGQTAHKFPYFLPDGRRFLYMVQGVPEVTGIYLGSLDGGAPVRLTAADRSGVYLPSGWLLWVRDGSLVAQRLDLGKPAVTGDIVTLASGVDFSVTELASERSAVSVAPTGTIAYRSAANSGRRLSWFDRSGRELGPFGDTANATAGKISPDGRRVVGGGSDGNVWVLDGTRATRLTFDTGKNNGRAVWSPDGTRIAWTANDGIYMKSASGAGAAQQLLASAQADRGLNAWTPDGRFLLYHASGAGAGFDLWILPVAGASTPTPFLKTRFNERNAALSPDGRWVAYQSDESGRFEVYVRPFVPPGSAPAMLETGAIRWQVSTAGGFYAAWRPDGRELYYLNPVGAMMAAPISASGTTLEPGAPIELFVTPIFGGALSSTLYRIYDVAPDGRFLMSTVPADAGNAPITLIQNWNPDAQERN